MRRVLCKIGLVALLTVPLQARVVRVMVEQRETRAMCGCRLEFAAADRKAEKIVKRIQEIN